MAGWLEGSQWLKTDETELLNRSQGQAFLTGEEEDEYTTYETLSDGRPGEQPITARYALTQAPHMIVIDFGNNRRVKVENWDGKVTAEIYDGDEMPRRTVELIGG
jgi:hypothetical protein